MLSIIFAPAFQEFSGISSINSDIFNTFAILDIIFHSLCAMANTSRAVLNNGSVCGLSCLFSNFSKNDVIIFSMKHTEFEGLWKFFLFLFYNLIQNKNGC